MVSLCMPRDLEILLAYGPLPLLKVFPLSLSCVLPSMQYPASIFFGKHYIDLSFGVVQSE